jgi:iron complex transport system ATP-binding protein
VRLVASGVVAGYGRRDVLLGVDLAVGPGLCALVGPNGAGKSTLVRVLAGLIVPREGTVTLEYADLGVALRGLGRAAIAQRIAVVPQVFDTLFPFTVGEVVMLGRTARLRPFAGPDRDDRAAVARALELLELRDLAGRRVDTLSGGERQRAVLAMALAQETDVLLLDEPTVHLDPAHQRATLALVRDLARTRGLAALAVLHDLNLASALADRIVVVAGGVVVADGTPGAVLTQSTVERVFGAGLRVLEDRTPPAVLPRG